MKKETDPRMHSAEHILNQTMVRMFDCGRSFNAHIEKKKSKCDYHFGRSLTDEELSGIQDRVNEIIRADLPITEEFLRRDQAETRFNLGKVPDQAGDQIRIVHIGDYDACACIGQHVASTAEIGEFRFVSATHDQGVLRVRFKLIP